MCLTLQTDIHYRYMMRTWHSTDMSRYGAQPSANCGGNGVKGRHSIFCCLPSVAARRRRRQIINKYFTNVHGLCHVFVVRSCDYRQQSITSVAKSADRRAASSSSGARARASRSRANPGTISTRATPRLNTSRSTRLIEGLTAARLIASRAFRAACASGISKTYTHKLLPVIVS